MNYIRNNKIYKSVCIFFALLVFNTSIDTPDMLAFNASENNVANTEINDIETMAELLLENMLDIENAIPEDETPDNQNHSPVHFFKVGFFYQPSIKSLIDTNPLNNKKDIALLHKEPLYTSQFMEVSTPPPKA